MKVPRHQLAAVLAKKSLDGADTEQLSAEIAAYLLAERRTSELDSLLRDIMEYRAEHGIVEVVAASAHELDSEAEKNIEAQVRELYPAAQKIIISRRHDPDMIGGVKVELANQQLDLSVRSKLNKFKQLAFTGKD